MTRERQRDEGVIWIRLAPEITSPELSPPHTFCIGQKWERTGGSNCISGQTNDHLQLHSKYYDMPLKMIRYTRNASRG